MPFKVIKNKKYKIKSLMNSDLSFCPFPFSLFRIPYTVYHYPFFILYFLFCIFSSSPAQSPVTYLYLEDDHYAFIDYQINSGRNLPRFVFQQPFEGSFLSDDMKAAEFFKNYWEKYYGDSLASGLSSQLMLADKGKYQNEVLLNRYQATGGIHIIYPHITLGNRTTIDQEYKYDPNYAGDLSESDNWLWGRVNDAYMNVNFKNFDFFIGRMKRNWGPIAKYSFLLSSQPYSYDHFLFSYQNNWLKLSIIFARLEDLNALGLDNPDNPDSLTYYPQSRKFLAGHRLDFRIRDNLQLGLSEMATYGGPDRDFDLSFLNPMTFYYGLQRNDKKQCNPNWTLDLFYKPVQKITLYGQLFIDDVIVNNEPGQDDRAQYDDRLAVYVSVRSGDLLLPGLNTDLSYTRVWNQTYQSRWTYENYHYRQLGLGYPCASCEEFNFKLGYWGLFPLFFQNEFIYGRYGNVLLTDVNLLQKEPFPVPPVTENLVNIFKLRYFFRTWLDTFLKVEYYKNPGHYLNRLNQDSDLTVSLGINLLLSGQLGFRDL